MSFFKVAVNAPIHGPLTYRGLSEGRPLAIGLSVEVPLGKRSVSGVVLEETQDDGAFDIKAINKVHEEMPAFPNDYLRWLGWVSDYYRYPIGQVVQLGFPPLKETKRKSKRSSPVPERKDEPKELSAEQQKIVNNISPATFAVHLVHGVTGSGKTEVYLNLIKPVVQSGKQALVLVPEISLTPQLISRFGARFANQVAVLHSGLTDRERTEQWWDARLKRKQILIGARSALFCPLEHLALIIMDEEHESSFKQDEKLKYHARDAAIVLAKQKEIPIVLGSATPSLESYYKAKTGKYFYHEMKTRVENRAQPRVTLIDRRRDMDRDRPFWLSPELDKKIADTLFRGEQVALFLNRRGVAQSVFCQSCGHGFSCPNCEIGLTLHGKRELLCHYCDYSVPLTDHCPQCQSVDIKPLGIGTEQVEDDIQARYPMAVVRRVDRDEITTREELENFVDQMEKGQIDILVGTQMIAKGLDFPQLTLVGVVLADVGFHLPDFRTSEKVFQLLTQVSGRSGRHSPGGGDVIVQTYDTSYFALQRALAHDYHGFAVHELERRKELHYPPFGRLACLRISGVSEKAVAQTCQGLKQRALRLKEKSPAYSDVHFLGPAPAPLARIRSRYRYHFLLKADLAKRLQSFLDQVFSDESWIVAQTKVQVDMDPINMM